MHFTRLIILKLHLVSWFYYLMLNKFKTRFWIDQNEFYILLIYRISKLSPERNFLEVVQSLDKKSLFKLDYECFEIIVSFINDDLPIQSFSKFWVVSIRIACKLWILFLVSFGIYAAKLSFKTIYVPIRFLPSNRYLVCKK